MGSIKAPHSLDTPPSAASRQQQQQQRALSHLELDARARLDLCLGRPHVALVPREPQAAVDVPRAERGVAADDAQRLAVRDLLWWW